MSVKASAVLRHLGALATIGVLFLLNGVGAGVVAILLATRRAPLGVVGGIALSAGAAVGRRRR